MVHALNRRDAYREKSTYVSIRQDTYTAVTKDWALDLHLHARTHARMHKRYKSDRATFTRYTLINADVGGTVSFKFHNSEST